MSMKATVRSSESIVSLRIVPATIPQKMQSASAMPAEPIPPALDQPASGVYTLVAPAVRAGEAFRPELFQDPAPFGARRDAQLASEVVAREGRPGRAVVVPGQGIAQHLAGEVEVRLDHLLARQRTLPACREPIGDGQQGDVGGHRLGRDEVVVDRPPRQRALMDQKAKPQVMESEPLKVRTEPATDLLARRDLGDHPGAHLVVADEGDVAGAF